METKHPEHRIKGLWFIAGTSYLRGALSEARFARFAEAMPAPFRDVVERPLPSEWYPEHAAACFLNAWLDVGAEGDGRRYERMVREASEQGMSRFFRAMARLSSWRFVLRRTPTIFKHLRSGPARVRVEDVEDVENVEDAEARDGGVLVHYERFPFLDDPIYTLTFPAQLGALVSSATGDRAPRVAVVGSSADSLTVEVRSEA
jgi:hypothetical protein